jgi:hypothetical protein
MKKIIKLILIFLALSLFSCTKRNNTTIFNVYGNNNLLDKKNVYMSVLKDDSITIYKNEKSIISFAYTIDDEGILVKYRNKKTPLYSFTKESLLRNDSLPPFFRHKERLLGKKRYFISKNKEYLIYSFVEYTGDDIFYTYYMENEGIICIYNYGENNYLYSNSLKAKEVSKLLLNDSTFFAKLDLERRLKKLKKILNH